jgi:multidrug efflux pump subunit AcrA (membrane-fusion protein)
MLLDDSALKDQEEEQQIKLETSQANKIKADKDYDITVKQNEISVAAAKNALALAEIDLEKFTGLDFDSSRRALAAIGGGVASLSEGGSYRQQLDDLTGKVRQAESELDQYRERSAWADRMAKLSYMTAAQAQAERSKLDSAVENLRSLQAQRSQHIIYIRKQQLTDYTSKRDNALLAYEQAILQAEANLAKASAEKQRATSEFVQQEEKLRDIALQRAECRVTAPDNIEPDSLVVYFKAESNRFSGSTQGMIEQGQQVKEGQKMLRIPNLHQMQVNTKVHEAMVARIRGDIRVPTHTAESVQKVMMLNTDPFTRLVSQRQDYSDRVHEKLRALGIRDTKTISRGQKAMVRVDALPERLFEGHVRTVAAVASQADAWISDVKLYQTLVVIDHELLPNGNTREIVSEEIKPDMTAEVTITVDTAKEPVLTVPVQSVIGGTEMGAKREVFVKTSTGYDRRPVTLGLYNEKSVEIREGLSEGDEIVLNPKVLMTADDRTRTRDEGGKGGGGNGKGAEGKGGDWKGGAKEAETPGGPAPGGPKGGGGKGRKGGGPPGGGPPGGGPPVGI